MKFKDNFGSVPSMNVNDLFLHGAVKNAVGDNVEVIVRSSITTSGHKILANVVIPQFKIAIFIIPKENKNRMPGELTVEEKLNKKVAFAENCGWTVFSVENHLVKQHHPLSKLLDMVKKAMRRISVSGKCVGCALYKPDASRRGYFCSGGFDEYNDSYTGDTCDRHEEELGKQYNVSGKVLYSLDPKQPLSPTKDSVQYFKTHVLKEDNQKVVDETLNKIARKAEIKPVCGLCRNFMKSCRNNHKYCIEDGRPVSELDLCTIEGKFKKK